MTNNAQTRLLAADDDYETDYVNNDKNFQWQREMEHHYHGKPRTPGQVLPEGTFSKEPSEIAHDLKQHSTDFAQAMSKLNSYINRQGRNLQGSDKERLYSAKEMLRNVFGVQEDGTSTSTDSTSTSASSELPIYSLPQGHNLDDGYLETGIDLPVDPNPTQPVTDNSGLDGETMKLNAYSRLQQSSLQNTNQNEGTDTFISHTVEAEKWSQKVTDHDDKSAVPEGTFDKSASDIAQTLKRVSDSEGQASSRLNFYKNRGGKNVDKSKLDHASELLRKSYGDK